MQSTRGEPLLHVADCSVPAEPEQPASSCCCCSRLAKVNRNVCAILVAVPFFSAGQSLFNDVALPTFIYEITGKRNALVGYIEATSGLCGMLAAWPVGRMGDLPSGRTPVIRYGGSSSIIVFGSLLGYAVCRGTRKYEEGASTDATSLAALFCAMAAFGVATICIRGPAQALYADSVPRGSRSTYFAMLVACFLLARTCGPIVAIVIFSNTGNVWRPSDLRNVVLAGIGLFTPSLLANFFMHDRYALSGDADAEALRGGADEMPDSPAALPRPRRVWLVKYLLFASSLCWSLGAGMTVKFLPLFFKNDCGLSPVGVNALYACVFPTGALWSGLVARASRSVGRVQIVMTCKLLSVCALVGLSIVKELADADIRRHNGTALLHDDDGGGYELEPPGEHSRLPSHVTAAIIGLFVLRAANAASVYSIEESIMMDFVPKERRARWKSLESVAAFGWAGSAGIGGYLADKHGYVFTFFITAAVQMLSIVIESTLLGLVPRKESSGAAARDMTRSTR